MLSSLGMIEEYPYAIRKFVGIQVVPLLFRIDDSGQFFGHPWPQPRPSQRVPDEDFKRGTDQCRRRQTMCARTKGREAYHPRHYAQLQISRAPKEIVETSPSPSEGQCQPRVSTPVADGNRHGNYTGLSHHHLLCNRLLPPLG
jgi:hypothetical protein